MWASSQNTIKKKKTRAGKMEPGELHWEILHPADQLPSRRCSAEPKVQSATRARVFVTTVYGVQFPQAWKKSLTVWFSEDMNRRPIRRSFACCTLHIYMKFHSTRGFVALRRCGSF